jgi:hypothetical protein
MAKRSEVGKIVFDRCFHDSYNGTECVQHAKDFITVGDKDPALAFAIGKSARRSMNAYVAVPFFRAALDGTKDSASCADDDLSRAVIAGLGLPPDDSSAADSRYIAANACWKTLQAPVEGELRKLGFAPTGYSAVNLCSVVKAKMK